MVGVPAVYAIDFGTSNSLIAAANADQIWPPLPIDPLASDPTVLRSVLFFSEDQRRFECGAAALGASSEGARGRLIRSIKRFLPAESFSDTVLSNRRYALEELVAIVLRTLRERANQHLGVDVRAAVLGCPARFSDDPREHQLAISRLEKAASLAGFEQVKLCEEPVAAALDCGERLEASELVMVVDLGGGTSDFTVARLESAHTEVLAVGGVAVAGDALDGALMRDCIAPCFGSTATYRMPFGENILRFPRPLLEKMCSPAELCLLDRRDVLDFLRSVRSFSLAEEDRICLDRLLCLVEDRLGFRLFEAIEFTKRALSDAVQAGFCFDYPGVELEDVVTRRAFERAAAGSLERILTRLDETLARAGVTASDVDSVYCTGGTARVPLIESAVARRFGAEKIRHASTFHAVVQGLAKRAQDWAGQCAGRAG